MGIRTGSLDVTAMRVHELALQNWLYRAFYVREGYPVPVVFAQPLDAFGLFTRLWKDANNPFTYLLDLKDADGTPLYEPYPSPVRYPLISVTRKNVRFRAAQNFSMHTWRHVNWPTVSDTGTAAVYGKEQTGIDLLKCQLGNVTTSRMPAAFDFRFQLDHFCLRPDTQAFFIERLMRQFWRTGGTLQTWIQVNYPGWGTQLVRLYLEGDVIEHAAPEEGDLQDKNVEFRTTVNLVVEGYAVDVEYQQVPALWTLRSSSASPYELNGLFYPPLSIDLRAQGTNLVLDSRTDIPVSGTCPQEHMDFGGSPQVISFGDPNQPSTPPDGWSYVPTYSYGIPSSAVMGIPTFGSMAPAPPGTVSTGLLTESGTNSAGLMAGSYDLYINHDYTSGSARFVSGTHFLTVVAGGTFSDYPAWTGAFVNGTYLSAIVNAGSLSDTGTQSEAFNVGTYALTAIGAGSYTESGTWAAAFYVGTMAQTVIPTGPYAESGTWAGAFYAGTYV